MYLHRKLHKIHISNLKIEEILTLLVHRTVVIQWEVS